MTVEDRGVGYVYLTLGATIVWLIIGVIIISAHIIQIKGGKEIRYPKTESSPLTTDKEQKVPTEKIDQQPFIKNSKLSDTPIIPDKSEISEVKTSECPFCGWEISEDTNFCGQCVMTIKSS